MKKLLFTAAALLMTGLAMAQNPTAEDIGQSQVYCPQMFNPQQFAVVGSNPARASWTGYGGTKLGQASTVGNWGASYTSFATGAQMDDATAWNAQSWIYTGMSSCTIGNDTSNNAYQRRFMVVDAGMDDLTGNHLSKVPSDPDTTFLRAIRLGNRCGGAGAEKLQYQFVVTPQNALLVLYYALSLENGQHDNANNPEFVVEVQVGTPGPSTVATDLNTYNYAPIGLPYFYVRPTPDHGNSNVAPFCSGATGTHTGASYGANIYLPWNKLLLDLGRYVNRPVRVLFGAGDCAYTAHYAYSYIAGYCRPRTISVEPCPQDALDAVARLSAPSGLEDLEYTADSGYHAYQWYVCNDPTLSAENIPFSYIDSTEWFDAHFTPVDGANYASFDVSSSYFIQDGQSGTGRAFACRTTTFMNKTTGMGGIRTYPIVNTLFADVEYPSSAVSVETDKMCDGTVSLRLVGDSTSAESAVVWNLYDGGDGLSAPIGTFSGREVTVRFDSISSYVMAVSLENQDQGCVSRMVQVSPVLAPKPMIAASSATPCEGQVVTLYDATDYRGQDVRHVEWRFSDGTTDSLETTSHVFASAQDSVWISTSNGMADSRGNACVADTFMVFRVVSFPEGGLLTDTVDLCPSILPYTYSIRSEEGISVYDTVFQVGTCSGEYLIMDSGSDCIDGVMLTLNVHDSAESVSLIAVSVDEENRAVVWFDDTKRAEIFRIYQLDDTNRRRLVGETTSSPWHEESARVWNDQRRYAVVGVDYCDEETALGGTAVPVYLSGNQNEEDHSVSLTWTGYEGDSVVTYNVYRGVGTGEMDLFLRDYPVNRVTDAPAGEEYVRYRVEAVLHDFTDTTVFSNYVGFGTEGIGDLQGVAVEMGPNPTTGWVRVVVGEPCVVSLYDLGGKELGSWPVMQELEVDAGRYGKGAMLMKATTADGRCTTAKLIVQ